MKGFRFYAEMPEGRVSKRASADRLPFTRATLKAGAAAGQLCNVVAVETEGRGRLRDAIASVTGAANSGVTHTQVDREWLRTCCTSIDEATARKLHPALFAVLDRG